MPRENQIHVKQIPVNRNPVNTNPVNTNPVNRNPELQMRRIRYIEMVPASFRRNGMLGILRPMITKPAPTLTPASPAWKD